MRAKVPLSWKLLVDMVKAENAETGGLTAAISSPVLRRVWPAPSGVNTWQRLSVGPVAVLARKANVAAAEATYPPAVQFEVSVLVRVL